jgi:outer membrane protein assembly factor BamB
MEFATSCVKPVLSAFCAACAVLFYDFIPANAQVNVTQFHNHQSRDGLYIDPAFTRGAAVRLKRDPNFDGTIVGNVYAQPLYIEDGPNGRAMVIVATESNNVYSLDARDGSIIWQRNVGEPVSAEDLMCTKFDPLGITGTPVVDLPSRALFFDAMITPDSGATKKHLIFSLNVDTGDVNPGWPVDVDAATYDGIHFDASIQQQRPALGIVGNTVYVGYGSMRDCSPFHGWLVGVPMNDPANLTAWAAATKNHGGAIWGVGGIASDGKNPFVTTGNTFNPPDWEGGHAVIRFLPGPIFSGSSTDYWVPQNWPMLDTFEWDLGSSGPLLVDVPGATPSRLVVALGKDRNMYLVNRDNLGGIVPPVATALVANSTILQAAAAYRTQQSTYVALRANNDGNTVLSAVRITATNPPVIASAWDINRGAGGCGSPFVTSTDGTNNMIVWVVGTEDHLTAGDQRLHGYDGNTGAVVYDGGGPNEVMAGTHYYSTTGIVARGRVYVAGDNKVFAFVLSRPSPKGRARPTPVPRPIR